MYKKRWIGVNVVLFLVIALLSISTVVAETNYCALSETLTESITHELKSLSVQSLGVTPQAEQAGAIFTITTNVYDDISLASVTFELLHNSDVVAAQALYDDGMHGDQSAGDGIFGNTWDSAGALSGLYTIRITATNDIGQTDVFEEANAFEIHEGVCIPMHNPGGGENLDIIFVPCDYDASESEKFMNDAQAHLDYLMQFPPFDDYNETINAHRVNRVGEMGCYYNGRCLLADGAEVQQLASSCNNRDTIVVIADSTEWAGCAYLGGVAHSSSAFPWITVHEFGHSFGSLNDEYSYGPSGPNYGPNCDSSGCTKWAGTEGTGCYSGCNYDNLFRPTPDSTMRSAMHQEFGPVNTGELVGLLNAYG